MRVAVLVKAGRRHNNDFASVRVGFDAELLGASWRTATRMC